MIYCVFAGGCGVSCTIFDQARARLFHCNGISLIIFFGTFMLCYCAASIKLVFEMCYAALLYFELPHKIVIKEIISMPLTYDCYQRNYINAIELYSALYLVVGLNTASYLLRPFLGYAVFFCVGYLVDETVA